MRRNVQSFRCILLLSLPGCVLSVASSSLQLVSLDPSNIPAHVDMSSYPSPTSSPSETPWGSNSNLRRHSIGFGGDVKDPSRAGKTNPFLLRRTVSVQKKMAEKRLDLTYEAAHSPPAFEGSKRMDHEYRPAADPSRLRAPIPVYTQLQQGLYPELHF
mmetsp:Transcript_43667/g.87744  ORF Transcript_43667/g.87744 Transcript_43667/m.87744 type:complete len:158 (-) Transcript_43667:101-574(-)